VDTQDPKGGRPFTTAGQKLDDVSKLLIDYINDEVVPMVRDHSSKGLRIASDKLKDLADYMESAQQKKG